MTEYADKDPLVALLRRVLEVAEHDWDAGDIWRVEFTGEYMSQLRSYLAGYDRSLTE